MINSTFTLPDIGEELLAQISGCVADVNGVVETCLARVPTEHNKHVPGGRRARSLYEEAKSVAANVSEALHALNCRCTFVCVPYCQPYKALAKRICIYGEQIV